MSSDPQAAVSNSIAHQQDPLIINSDVEAQARAKDKASYRSLPNKKQLAILCIARLVDPLAATSIQVWPNLIQGTILTSTGLHVLPA